MAAWSIVVNEQENGGCIIDVLVYGDKGWDTVKVIEMDEVSAERLQAEVNGTLESFIAKAEAIAEFEEVDVPEAEADVSIKPYVMKPVAEEPVKVKIKKPKKAKEPKESK